MADDLNLQIILSAINETGDPFKAMDESIQTFQKAASDLAKSIEDSFKSITSAITTATSSIEGSMKDDSAALVDFGKSASDQTKVVEDSLSGASKAATDVAKSMSTAAADIDKDMQTAAKAVGEFEKTAETDLAGASQSMSGLRDNMNKGIDKIGGLLAIQMFGQSLEHVGKQGEKLFDFAIGQGADFQQTMKNVQTVIAVNSDGQGDWNTKLKDSVGITDQLQQKALDLGSRGAQSANEVGKAADAMLRGGVDASAVLDGALQAAQNVAIVSGDTMSDSADLITNVYHDFRSEFEKNNKSVQQNMTDSGNVITGVLLSAKVSSTEFADTFKYVGPLAAQLGSSLLDASTATAVLARNGISGSQAGTNLKRVFTNLLAPTKEGAAALSELGIIQNGHNLMVDESTGKLKTLTEMQAILSKSTEGLTEVKKAQYEKEIFGQYALTGSLVLINQNTSEYGKLKEKIGNVDAEKAAANMLDTFSGHMKQLEAHVQTTAKEFGLAFIPVLEKLLPIGQKILDWFQNLSPHTKELMMGVLGVGSALAVFGGALATMAISLKFAGEGLKALQAVFAIFELSSPIGWIILIGTVVVAAVVLIVSHWEQIKTWVLQNFGISIPAVFKSFSDTFTNVWNGIKSIFKSVWDYIQPTITAGIKAVSDYWNVIWPKIQKVFTEVWDVMKAVLTPFLEVMKFEITTAIDIIKAIWQDAWNMIKDAFKLAWDLISGEIQIGWDLISGIFNVALDLLTGNWKGAWNDLKSTFSKVWDDIKGMFGNLLTDALDFGKNFVQMVADGIMSGVHAVENAVSNVASKIKGFLGFHSPAEEGPGAEADVWMPNLFKMMTNQIQQNIPNMQAALQVAFQPQMIGVTNMSSSIMNMAAVTNMAPVMSSGGGANVYNFNMPISGNIATSEDHLANIVKKKLLDAMKGQGKV